MKLKSEQLRALKIICNDIKVELIPQELNIEIPLLTFAWAFEWVGIIGQTFRLGQKMRKKIPSLLIPMSSFKPPKNRKLRG